DMSHAPQAVATSSSFLGPAPLIYACTSSSPCILSISFYSHSFLVLGCELPSYDHSVQVSSIVPRALLTPASLSSESLAAPKPSIEPSLITKALQSSYITKNQIYIS
ncbi:hypothetical protein U1Q18_032203, partial [Sarracenia purpurea var. burkii]